MSIKVRFAPSPTGYLHVGGLRTALYNYLYAKKAGGKLVLRIEDTDQNRKVEGAEQLLISTFEKIGISFDEGPMQSGEDGHYFQSQRLDIYNNHIQLLLNNGNAYPCFCSAERLERVRDKQRENKETIIYDRHCLNISKEAAKDRMKSEPHVIRMKIPDEDVVFYDVVREKVSIKSSEIDDQVLMKTDGFPTYHFANVVDDRLMGITHVMRGEEWLPSTPKHVLLYQFFGWKLPKFIHLPLLLNPDKSKLSKRQGDVAVEDYLDKGYLPETLINFVALLGWHPKNDREFFTLKELEEEFSIKRIQKAGAVFDIEKLKWMNGHYLRENKLEEIAEKTRSVVTKAGLDISDKRKYLSAIDNARKRVDTINDMLQHILPFYQNLDFSKEDLKLLKKDSSQKVINFWSEQLSSKSDWNEVEIKSLVKETTTITGVKGKDLFFPLRLALFGSTQGPDIPLIIEILGVEETIKRFKMLL
ncbi:MAG: glutamate--tRNA ligase [Candidatus Marinimicrobia bacterium]|nr:glutamate--tRNA ligase [Candidatus Neomarinimicrobiota bacterium]MBL7108983.1 glutamate--tRNA ligase [Candidatus Neomarinimicrobiota bacterium]